MNAELPIGELELSALIGSRLCHDLVSPVGAIGNGVELLAMDGAGGPMAPGAAELGLIRESVENAQARLRFFRIAFGQAGDEQQIGRAEVLEILTALYESGRLKVHWAVEGARPRGAVKLAFLMLQCLESAMPYGGQVRICEDSAGWRVEGTAEKLRMEPALWEAASGGPVPVDLRPSQVQFALVAPAAARAGLRPEVETGPTRIAFRAHAPQPARARLGARA